MKMSLIAGLDLRLVLLKRYFTQEKKENVSLILFQNLFAVLKSLFTVAFKWNLTLFNASEGE